MSRPDPANVADPGSVVEPGRPQQRGDVLLREESARRRARGRTRAGDLGTRAAVYDVVDVGEAVGELEAQTEVRETPRSPFDIQRTATIASSLRTVTQCCPDASRRSTSAAGVSGRRRAYSSTSSAAQGADRDRRCSAPGPCGRVTAGPLEEREPAVYGHPQAAPPQAAQPLLAHDLRTRRLGGRGAVTIEAVEASAALRPRGVGGDEVAAEVAARETLEGLRLQGQAEHARLGGRRARVEQGRQRARPVHDRGLVADVEAAALQQATEAPRPAGPARRHTESPRRSLRAVRAGRRLRRATKGLNGLSSVITRWPPGRSTRASSASAMMASGSSPKMVQGRVRDDRVEAVGREGKRPDVGRHRVDAGMPLLGRAAPPAARRRSRSLARLAARDPDTGRR